MQYLKKVVWSPPKKGIATEHPATAFAKLWQSVQAILSIKDASAPEHISETDLPRRFALMADLLAAESRRSDESTTGPCLELLFKHDILGSLVRLSLPDQPEGIKGETVRFFAGLVVLLDERFLVHSAVHRPLLRLLNGCIQPDGADEFAVVSADYEVDLVDLLSFVANRIRSFPELLPVFFHNRTTQSRSPSKSTHIIDPLEHRIGQADRSQLSRNGRHSPTLSEGSSAPSSNNMGTSTRSTAPGEYEFLIFSYLLRFVHREGRIGDLARAGLLFLIDVALSAGAHPLAMTPPQHLSELTLALAEFLLDIDFASVLVAGIGALYGLLPSKLAVRVIGSSTAGAMALGGMSEAPSLDDLQAEEIKLEKSGLARSDSPAFRDALAVVLKLVAFTQDVLQRIPSPDATQGPTQDATSTASVMSSSVALVGACLAEEITLNMQTVFVESVLYPSMMECSELDGSGVAVLAYLDAILSVLDSGSQIALAILDYLCSDGQQNPVAGSGLRDGRRLKRKSDAMLLIEGLRVKKQDDKPFVGEGRFTLRDLLLQHLECPLPAARLAACRLLATIVGRHQRTTPYLLRLNPLPSTAPREEEEADDEETFIYPVPVTEKTSSFKAVDASIRLLRHSAEMSDLLQLLAIIDPSTTVVASFTDPRLSRYAEDAEALVANGLNYTELRYSLDASDKMLRSICDNLAAFFRQDPSTNLQLTGVLVALTSCSSCTLDSWLLPSAFCLSEDIASLPDGDFSQHDDGDDRSIDHIIEDHNRLDLRPSGTLTATRWGAMRSQGLVIGLLEKLATDVATARAKVADFDELLSERRNGLLFVESLADALSEAEAASSPQPKALVPSSVITNKETRSPTNPFAAHYARTAALPSPLGEESGTLSLFMDNVVILEEVVKEIVAVIQCRRSLGIDPW